MSSFQYRKSHSGDKRVIRSSYLHNGIYFTSQVASFYWINPLVYFLQPTKDDNVSASTRLRRRRWQWNQMPYMRWPLHWGPATLDAPLCSPMCSGYQVRFPGSLFPQSAVAADAHGHGQPVSDHSRWLSRWRLYSLEGNCLFRQSHHPPDTRLNVMSTTSHSIWDNDRGRREKWHKSQWRWRHGRNGLGVQNEMLPEKTWPRPGCSRSGSRGDLWRASIIPDKRGQAKHSCEVLQSHWTFCDNYLKALQQDDAGSSI